jgi:RHS repeat-associated protein
VQNVIKKFGSEKFSTKTFAYDNTYDRRLTYVGEGGIECYLYYDNEGRNNSKIVYGEGVKLYESKTYYLSKNSVTTQLSSKIAYTFTNGGNSSISYEYDANENITRIYDGKYNTYYTYDSLNRLVREDNEYFNTSKYYIYDDMGNLLGYKSAPKYTTATDVTSTMLSQTNYTYNSGKIVKDADGKSIAYDAVGNPTLYRGLSATWKNCKLTKLGNTTFEYNTNGRRFKKNSIEYYYDVMGKLVKSSDGLSYYYDNNKLLGFSYCGKTYIYVTDIQDNIIKILDSDGNIVVNYYYDAWGNFKVNGDSTIANINPFRYRGYFYDIETGLYYLNTRYYDPQIGRFISIDEISCASPETINGLNLYAYCYNNPIKYVDINGRTPIDFGLMGELLDYMSSIPFACLAGLAQNAGRTDVFNVINKVAGKAGKASSALGTGLIFLQAGFTIYDEVNSGVSIGRAISDAAYDVILSLVEIKIAACIVAAFSLTGVVASVATFGVGLAIVGGIYLLNKYCPQVEQVLKDAFYCVASEVVEGVVTICTDLNNALNVVGDYLNDWFKSVVGWVHQWI